MTEGVLVQVFRSARRDGHYLFVALDEGLARVPPPLLDHFGTAEPALRLHLTPQRKLAQAEARVVLEAIASQGFYLQMPPREERKLD